MNQPPEHPGLLTAEDDELIAGQYADRPGLRPVLDAVLAALPALGPVTVGARKTLVSLVSPRRVTSTPTSSRTPCAPGGRLVARVRLTDAKGNPICARVRPPYITWSAVGEQ